MIPGFDLYPLAVFPSFCQHVCGGSARPGRHDGPISCCGPLFFLVVQLDQIKPHGAPAGRHAFPAGSDDDAVVTPCIVTRLASSRSPEHAAHVRSQLGGFEPHEVAEFCTAKLDTREVRNSDAALRPDSEDLIGCRRYQERHDSRNSETSHSAQPYDSF